MDKEQLQADDGVEDGEGERPGWVERVGKEPEPEGELESYVEKVERAGEKHLSQSVTDDNGQPVVQASDDAQVPDDAVILPLTKDEFEQGLHEQLLSSLRWLAEWSLYLIKKYGERVFFRG